jgi:hypothetical protein
MKGPYAIDWWDDYGYVVSDDGTRVAECDTREKAELVCAAMNLAHYFCEVGKFGAQVAQGEQP